jgi:hypothetical protein
MRITTLSPQDPLLKKLSTLVSIGNRIIDISQGSFEDGQSSLNNNRASFDGGRAVYNIQQTPFGENRTNFLTR